MGNAVRADDPGSAADNACIIRARVRRRNAGSFGVKLRLFPAPGRRLGALMILPPFSGPAVEPIRPN